MQFYVNINLSQLLCHATAKPLIISYNGASGDYPSSTDVAYTRAISDGADVIDCNVQMTKDGVPICLSSVNLIDSTKAAQSKFSILTTKIPEIQSTSGIFTFNLTWTDIETLTRKLNLEDKRDKYKFFFFDKWTRFNCPCIYWHFLCGLVLDLGFFILVIKE